MKTHLVQRQGGSVDDFLIYQVVHLAEFLPSAVRVLFCNFNQQSILRQIADPPATAGRLLTELPHVLRRNQALSIATGSKKGIQTVSVQEIDEIATDPSHF